MKIKIWDILSVLGLLATIGLAILMLMIFANPRSGINLFPPPTDIPTVMIPTSTPTLLQLPPTWTLTPEVEKTITLAPSQTALPTSTSFVLPTYTPSWTPSSTPTLTLEATMTFTAGNDQAQEINQTPSDGTSFSTGADFDLSWEVKNIGTNDWSTNYYYEYQSGVKSSKQDLYHLSSAVNDGDTINLIVDMIAPYDKGNYSTTWVLKNSSGDTMKTLVFTFSVK